MTWYWPNTAMVAVATSFVGVIAFMGLIVPHLVRLLIGSNNRRLLPASAILGAALLTLADLAARLLLAPAEMPIEPIIVGLKEAKKDWRCNVGTNAI